MRLLGIDNLYKNDYNVVKVSKNIFVVNNNSSTSDMVILKDKSDDEKRKLVIEYFLNQNIISKVLNEATNYVVISVDGREMLINKEYINDNIIDNIYNKYYVDRQMYYRRNNYDAYEIVTSSFEDCNYYIEYRNKEYGMEGLLRNRSVLKIFVPLIDDKLRKEDEMFLLSFLNDISDVCYYNSGWNNNVLYEAYKNGNIALNIDKELSWLLCKLRDKEDEEKEEKIKKIKERYL